MKKMTKSYYFTLFIMLFLLPIHSQMSKNEIRKKQWLGDLSISGVGVEMYTPNIGEYMTSDERWVGLNLIFGPIIFGIGQGSLSTFEPVNDFIPGLQSLIATGNLRTNKIYVGTSIPLSIFTIGKYRSYNNSFRSHPIINMTFGGYRIYESFGETKPKSTSSFFSVAPGYRFRLPCTGVDFNLNMRINFSQDGKYENFQKKGLDLYPQITLR